MGGTARGLEWAAVWLAWDSDPQARSAVSRASGFACEMITQATEMP